MYYDSWSECHDPHHETWLNYYLVSYLEQVRSLACVTVGEEPRAVLLLSLNIAYSSLERWMVPGSWLAATPTSWDLIRSYKQRSTGLGHSPWTRNLQGTQTPEMSLWCRMCSGTYACWVCFSFFKLWLGVVMLHESHMLVFSVSRK